MIRDSDHLCPATKKANARLRTGISPPGLNTMNWKKDDAANEPHRGRVTQMETVAPEFPPERMGSMRRIDVNVCTLRTPRNCLLIVQSPYPGVTQR